MISINPDNSSGDEKTPTHIGTFSNLKVKDEFEGITNTFYADLDIKNAPEVEDAEFNKMLKEEGDLRDELRKLGLNDFTLTSEDKVRIAKDLGCESLLVKWFTVHMRNKAIIIKKGNADIMLIPSTQTLLEAALLLQKES